MAFFLQRTDLYAAPWRGLSSSMKEKTMTEKKAFVPKDETVTRQLSEYGDDETVTDRVNTNLGRLLEADHLARLNINTQADAVVYLRGPVQSQEQAQQIEQCVKETEGVKDVVNELNIVPGFKV
jgi:osmotically-inducible protein OsmY